MLNHDHKQRKNTHRMHHHFLPVTVFFFLFFQMKGKLRVCFSQGRKQKVFMTERFSRDWKLIYMITVTDGVADFMIQQSFLKLWLAKIICFFLFFFGNECSLYFTSDIPWRELAVLLPQWVALMFSKFIDYVAGSLWSFIKEIMSLRWEHIVPSLEK